MTLEGVHASAGHVPYFDKCVVAPADEQVVVELQAVDFVCVGADGVDASSTHIDVKSKFK